MPAARFLAPLALLLVAAVPGARPAAADGDGIRLRAVAANVSSGRFQSYPIAGPGLRILRALDADLVLIQELSVRTERDDPDGDQAVDAWVYAGFGPGFHWSREPGEGEIKNGVISRWPILEHGEWPDPEIGNRDFAWARIDLPGEIDLWAVSVHFASRGSGRRRDQAAALVAAIRAHPVPEEDYLLIGGDFNTRTRGEAALAELGALVQSGPPFPDDGAEVPDGDTNTSRRRPYDWVLADPQLDALATATVYADLTFPHGLVFDTRLFHPATLEAVFPPARVTDSEARVGGVATNMQHMAVVRDFRLPAAGGDDDDDGDDDDGDDDDGDDDDGDDDNEDGDGDGDDDDGDGAAGSPFDAGGVVVEQQGSAAQLVLPAGTSIPAGGTLVIGRAVDRAAFESFWGPLGENVVYLNGGALAGDPGFPLINGDERFRLRRADGTPLDPPGGGTLPSVDTPKGRAYQRQATDTETFTVRLDANAEASPGRYEGVAAGTGRLVITEHADAAGGGNFIFEFVELFYDAPRP